MKKLFMKNKVILCLKFHSPFVRPLVSEQKEEMWNVKCAIYVCYGGGGGQGGKVGEGGTGERGEEEKGDY